MWLCNCILHCQISSDSAYKVTSGMEQHIECREGPYQFSFKLQLLKKDMHAHIQANTHAKCTLLV